MGTKNTILIRGEAIKETGLIASEALEPGHLVEFGGSDDIQKHSTAGGSAQKMFVREQWENEGAGIGDTIASGDEATVLFPERGAKVYAWLADGNNVTAKGTKLESDGAGLLQLVPTEAATADTERDSTVGYAAEVVNASGSNERIEIYVA